MIKIGRVTETSVEITRMIIFASDRDLFFFVGGFIKLLLPLLKCFPSRATASSFLCATIFGLQWHTDASYTRRRFRCRPASV